MTPFPWKQSEHMALVGDSGTGKTTLAAYLLLCRRNTIAFRSKADDAHLPGKLVRTARAIEREVAEDRFLLEPRHEAQRDEFARAFNYAWRESTPRGGWTLYVDELLYMDRMLKLGAHVDRVLTQGRSKRMTMITGMQRPVGTTRYALAEARHVITFGLADGREAKTFGDATSRVLVPYVESLGRYEFLWYYRPEKRFAICTLDRRAGSIVAVRRAA